MLLFLNCRSYRRVMLPKVASAASMFVAISMEENLACKVDEISQG